MAIDRGFPYSLGARRYSTLTSLLVLLGSLALMGATVAACGAAQASKAQVKHGEHLVRVLGCNDCHTPHKIGPNGPEPDMTRMLSGHPENVAAPKPPTSLPEPWVWAGTGSNTAFAGPWGITYAANLTPDQNTGIGIWTEDMFLRAIKLGKHMGQSRQIMPPMPWPAFSNLDEQDLRAIYRYLRSIPTITNHVPDYQSPEDLDYAAKWEAIGH
ncbi:MAG: diheme cytochrome c-553 [Acidobacteriota bacterium]